MKKIKHKILGQRLKTINENTKIYLELEEAGFDYVLNPATEELHRVSLSNFEGAHNLTVANLKGFIGIKNIGELEIHELPDGVLIPIYDLDTGEFLGEYLLNKCLHCFS